MYPQQPLQRQGSKTSETSGGSTMEGLGSFTDLKKQTKSLSGINSGYK
jgi:hypothetical protein